MCIRDSDHHHTAHDHHHDRDHAAHDHDHAHDHAAHGNIRTGLGKDFGRVCGFNGVSGLDR